MHMTISSSTFKRIFSYSFLLVGYAGILCLFLLSYDKIIQGYNLIVNSCSIIVTLVIYILVNHLLTNRFVSAATIRTYELSLIVAVCMCTILFSNYAVINSALANSLRFLVGS